MAGDTLLLLRGVSSRRALHESGYDGGARTSAFEALALGGVLLYVAGTEWEFAGLARRPTDERALHSERVAAWDGLGIVAISMIVFGVQHFLYAAFIATLIPAWMPGHLFLAYFTGVAFVAGGIGLLVRRVHRAAAFGLGTMFLLWVLLLHGPRVAKAPHTGAEWTSLMVALAFAGGLFAMAETVKVKAEVGAGA